MPRALWTGAISVGPVNVPVRMYSAISDNQAPARTEPEAPVDLMAALQASLDASKKNKAAARKPAKRRKAA